MDDIITTLKILYGKIKPEIDKRFCEFTKNNTREKMEKEFFFCLLTPQCKAKVCWQNVERLYGSRLLLTGLEKDIAENFRGIRFRNNKARYIVDAREKFFNGFLQFERILSEKNPYLLRDYIVENIKGMGYKEASHFLRNIGKGSELAILDRHILRGLKMAGVIDDVPASLTKKKYIEIEKAMKEFAEKKIRIPVSHLDFVFWHFFNGEVFK